MWQKLKNSDDRQILQYLNQVENIKQIFKLSTRNDYNMILNGKFRGIDPWVSVPNMESISPKIDKYFVWLTDLDSEFKSEFERVKNIINSDWPIKFML